MVALKAVIFAQSKLSQTRSLNFVRRDGTIILISGTVKVLETVVVRTRCSKSIHSLTDRDTMVRTDIENWLFIFSHIRKLLFRANFVDFRISLAVYKQCLGNPLVRKQLT